MPFIMTLLCNQTFPWALQRQSRQLARCENNLDGLKKWYLCIKLYLTRSCFNACIKPMIIFQGSGKAYGVQSLTPTTQARLHFSSFNYLFSSLLFLLVQHMNPPGCRRRTSCNTYIGFQIVRVTTEVDARDSSLCILCYCVFT